MAASRHSRVLPSGTAIISDTRKQLADDYSLSTSAASESARRASRIQLEARYLTLFPDDGVRVISKIIVGSALAIPTNSQLFHERLLDAYLHASNPGSRQQLYTAKAIENLFGFNSTDDVKGKHGHSSLSLMITRILKCDDAGLRHKAMQKMFQTMETGSCGLVLSRMNGHTRCGDSIVNVVDQSQCGNLIDLLDEVLIKRGEIENLGSELDTTQYVSQLAKNGLQPEEIATEISGTSHTAYLNDMRLARKVVSLMLEAGPYMRETSSDRDEARTRLEEAFWTFICAGKPLGAKEIIALLKVNPSFESQLLIEQWEDKKFVIETWPVHEFDEIITRWGRVHKGSISILLPARSAGGPQRIVIREMPALDIRSAIGSERSFLELVNRPIATIHEWEHWCHFNGSYQGIERASKPIPSLNRKPHDSRVSEMMAFLEEQRWRMKNFDIDCWILAQRLGMTLPQYLLYNVEQSYKDS